jgi:hypothetical protein
MKRNTFKVGWVVAVLMLVTLACTCGPLSQVTQGMSTVQAVASQAQGLATQGSELQTSVATAGVFETVEALSTQVATSGAVETALAAATDSSFGQGPADIPVYADHTNLFATAEVVSYTTSGTFDQVSEFYKTEMPNNGWTQSQDAISMAGMLVLTYTKDNRTATVTVTDGGAGGGITVAVAIQ